MSKTIELIKGTQTRTVSEFEYDLIRDDMNGWEVNKAAPEVPEEVAVWTEKKTRKNSKQ